MFFGVCFELFFMETRTVKLLKALPNMSRKVMPIVIVATKYSKNKKDLGDLKIVLYLIASRVRNMLLLRANLFYKLLPGC